MRDPSVARRRRLKPALYALTRGVPIEALLVQILQLLYEASLQAACALALMFIVEGTAKTQEDLRSRHPVAVQLVYMLCGIGIGTVSLAGGVLPAFFIGPGFWRAVSVLSTPILAGLVMLVVSRLRGRSEGAHSRLRPFFAGWGFAVCMAVTRIVLYYAPPGGELWTGVEHPSPNGTYVAAFYALSRGSGGVAAQYVSIRPAGSPLDTRDFVLEWTYAFEACLRWVKDDQLLIEIPEQAEVYRHTGASHGVMVTHSETFRKGSCDGCVALIGAHWGSCSTR